MRLGFILTVNLNGTDDPPPPTPVVILSPLKLALEVVGSHFAPNLVQNENQHHKQKQKLLQNGIPHHWPQKSHEQNGSHHLSKSQENRVQNRKLWLCNLMCSIGLPRPPFCTTSCKMRAIRKAEKVEVVDAILQGSLVIMTTLYAPHQTRSPRKWRETWRTNTQHSFHSESKLNPSSNIKDHQSPNSKLKNQSPKKSDQQFRKPCFMPQIAKASFHQRN